MDTENLIKLFRDKIKSRGARGIIGLQRVFKIMDDDNSKSLSFNEFSKAVRDFRIGIAESHLPSLFDHFDLNRDGTLNIDEFLFAIRGDLNERRLQIVKQAFARIDRDSSGSLDVNDIKGLYKTDKHPDVMQGKKTED